MKISTKIIIVLVLCIAGLLWYSVLLYQKSRSFKPASPIEIIAKKQIQTEAKEISKEVGKNGLTHTIYKMVKEIDQSKVDRLNADLLDTLKVLGIARERLKQILAVNANLEIKNQKLERKVTALATTYTHNDDHFNLFVSVPVDSSQSATFNLSYDADLITTQYNKRRWWIFGENQIDIYSNDPRFTIRGLRALTVKPRNSSSAVQLQSKVGYNKYNGFFVGPAVRVKLGKFELESDYKYSLTQNAWVWGAGAAYNLNIF